MFNHEHRMHPIRLYKLAERYDRYYRVFLPERKEIVSLYLAADIIGLLTAHAYSFLVSSYTIRHINFSIIAGKTIDR